jgi:hypothetical protein
MHAPQGIISGIYFVPTGAVGVGIKLGLGNLVTRLIELVIALFEVTERGRVESLYEYDARPASPSAVTTGRFIKS